MSVAFSIDFPDGRRCPVRLGTGALQALPELWRPQWRQAALCGDATVMRLYGERVAGLLEPLVDQLLVIDFPPGEAFKTRETKANLEDELLEAGLGRQSCLVALGGGISLDLVGFLAATYLRGVAHLNLPTSLLAQVDAAFGGKTGVNTRHGKNLIGAFQQPAAVLVDPAFLTSLPIEEWRCGLGELVKHAVIADAALFAWLEQEVPRLVRPIQLDSHPLRRCLEIKASVVAADERESGLRAVLNFGHTIGHAVEHALEHRLGHGAAVAVGMTVEAQLAHRRCGFPLEEIARLQRLLSRLGLPAGPPLGLSFDRLLPFLAVDKKRRDGQLQLALPRRLGEMATEPGSHTIACTAAELERAWAETTPAATEPEECAGEIRASELTTLTEGLLCVTGGERRCSELAARLQAYQPYALQEVRLDLLQDLDDSVLPLLRGPKVLVACRSAEEGGEFRGSEGERLALLRRALREQPGFLDLELSVPNADWQSFLAARGETRLLCSHHVLQPGADLEPLAERLRAVPAQLHKLAVQVEDAAELLPLLKLSTGRPLLRVGMGPAGLLSRALPCQFGSPWSYVFANDAPATAPGQLSVAQAAAWRVDQSRDLAPLALLGGPQVLSSPGPQVYNRLFATRGLPFIYLPVITCRPAEALELLRALGARGMSVTMPLKEAVMPFLDRVDAGSQLAGATNSVRCAQDDERLGRNTDVEAVAELAGPGSDCQSLVLGAGGAARAAAVALLQAGWQVTVTSRSESRARRLADQLRVAAVLWEQRDQLRAALLVNATPCGSDGLADPVPSGVDLRGCTVLDMVARSEGPTPLVRRATAAGARVISGLEMWLRQGALQMSWLTGTPLEVDELRRHHDG